MDWLSDICKGLALAVLNEFGKGITSRTLDVVHPSGETMKATVTVSFRVPVQATIQRRESISRLEMLRDAPISVSALGDAGTTVSITAPDYAERLAEMEAAAREAATA
jgi:hypothetical protein